MTDPFDFPRYFARVQSTPEWHQMQTGMADFAGVQPGMWVLDLGCGPGRLVSHLCQTGVQAIGADGDIQMAAKAHTIYARLPVVVTLAERLPFTTNQFDAVLAGNLLFFLPDPLSVLQEMGRIVRPGGCVAIWNPSEQMSRKAAFQYTVKHPDIDEFVKKHVVNWAGIAEANRRWSEADLRQMFFQAGLVEFASETTLGGLARYARGQKPVNSEQ